MTLTFSAWKAPILAMAVALAVAAGDPDDDACFRNASGEVVYMNSVPAHSFDLGTPKIRSLTIRCTPQEGGTTEHQVDSSQEVEDQEPIPVPSGALVSLTLGDYNAEQDAVAELTFSFLPPVRKSAPGSPSPEPGKAGNRLQGRIKLRSLGRLQSGQPERHAYVKAVQKKLEREGSAGGAAGSTEEELKERLLPETSPSNPLWMEVTLDAESVAQGFTAFKERHEPPSWVLMKVEDRRCCVIL